MNFLVNNFSDKYSRMVKIVLWQLTETIDEEDITRRVIQQNPWVEEFCLTKDKEEYVLAVISVEETRPLQYNVVARFDRENMELCNDS